jgi:hypothetical protein
MAQSIVSQTKIQPRNVLVVDGKIIHVDFAYQIQVPKKSATAHVRIIHSCPMDRASRDHF